MFDAVIFEADGALVDSLDLQVVAWLEAFAWFGKRPAAREVHAQLGEAGEQLVAAFLTDAEVRQMGEHLESWRADFYRRNGLPRVLPFPRVRALVRALEDRGLEVAVVSGGPRQELEQLLELCNIHDRVTVAVAREDVGRGRPRSALSTRALERLEVPVERAALVTATPHGVAAAGRLGLFALGLRGGGFSSEALSQAGAGAVYDDPADLLDHLDRSPLVAGQAAAAR
jgi:beta-phosphoglucomutase-like phosphatase (HAD superfamily)